MEIRVPCMPFDRASVPEALRARTRERDVARFPLLDCSCALREESYSCSDFICEIAAK